MSGAAQTRLIDEPVPAHGIDGLGRLVAAGVLALAVAAAGWPVVGDFLDRPVRSVRIAGDFVHVPRVKLEQVIEPHLARGFARLEVDAVRAAVAALPWVRQASVRRVWPDSLHVAIVERVPVARWQDTRLLEADGLEFAPDQPHEDATLPRLHGPPGSAAAVLEFWTRLDRIAREIGERVVRLDLSALGNRTALLAGGATLVMDANVDVEALARYLRGFPRLFGERLGEVERIDLRYTNGFAVRWRRAPRAPEGRPS